MDILKSLEHRMNILETTNSELEESNFNSEENTSELDQKITNELSELKKETKRMLEECNTIHKTIFNLGKELQDKVTKQELQKFDKQLQEWPIEEFITIKELPFTFNKYANQ